MPISQRTKITTKELGDPAIIKTLEPTVKKHMLGTIVGIVSGFCERANPKDPTEKFEGLTGNFRSIPVDDKRDELESGVLFIPDAFHNMIAAPFRQMQASDPNARLSFAFEVASVRANNAAGYSWDFTPKMDAAGGNPLDALIAGIGSVKTVDGKRTLALAAPEKAPATAAKK